MIEITVTEQQQGNPAVAKALGDLMLALGGAKPAAARAAPEGAGILPHERAKLERLMQRMEDRGLTRKERFLLLREAMAGAWDEGVTAGAKALKQEATSQVVPPAKPAKPTKTKAKAKAVGSLDDYPEQTRAFLWALRKRGHLTIEAARELMDKPKELGGILGSLTRWSKRKGARNPVELEKHGTLTIGYYWSPDPD